MESVLRIYCDGGARGNPGPAAAAIVVEKGGKVLDKQSRFLGKLTNNQAEYQAAILGLKWLNERPPRVTKQVTFVMDSELVAKQLSGFFRIKNENLRNLFLTAKNYEKKIKAKIFYRTVPRTRNKIADFLVNQTLDENS